MNIDKGKMTAKAIVSVKLEIIVGSTWGSGCSLAQVYDQANEEAMNILRNLLMKAEGKVRAVGEATITATKVEIAP